MGNRRDTRPDTESYLASIPSCYITSTGPMDRAMACGTDL